MAFIKRKKSCMCTWFKDISRTAVFFILKIMKQLRISNKLVVTTRATDSSEKESSFFHEACFTTASPINTSALDYYAPLLSPTALIYLTVVLDFLSSKMCQPGATSLNLFHHERKYFCLSPRAARKVRTVSITKLKHLWESIALFELWKDIWIVLKRQRSKEI